MLKKHTMEFYDWFEIKRRVEERNNVDLRDFKTKETRKALGEKATSKDPWTRWAVASKDSHDFWHFAMEHLFYGAHNGSYCTFDPWTTKAELEADTRMATTAAWAIEALDLFIEVLEAEGIKDEIKGRIAW